MPTSKIFAICLLFIGFAGQAYAPAQAQNRPLQRGEIAVNGIIVKDIQVAFNTVLDDGYIRIGPGIYNQAGSLTKNGVTIIGSRGTHFKGKIYKGKATFVIRGKNTTMKNIECSDANGPSNNGGCIRLENENLKLINVYFHDSQSGILTVAKPGNVDISDSLFERIGHSGRAHAVYMSGGRLAIRRSIFLSAKDQAHEIKSRADLTVIQNSVIASLDGNDSRLVDIPNGGRVILKNNLFVEGPKTVNYQIISWGVEGLSKSQHSFDMENNMIVSDRQAGSVFLGIHKDLPAPNIKANVFIGRFKDKIPENNAVLKSRDAYGFGPHPDLPFWPPANRALKKINKILESRAQ